MARGNPAVKVRLQPDEREELTAMCRAAGIDLSSAMRRGARIYLDALALTGESRPGKRKEERLAA